MSWYLALESGKFWFPAQVYNRENGHIGFMLSCYDAELSYDQRTTLSKPDVNYKRVVLISHKNYLGKVIVLKFVVLMSRYPPHGRRASAIETGATWKHVMGMPITADVMIATLVEVLNYIPSLSDWLNTLVLEFNQYTLGSRWRRTTVSRKDHREEGNEADGFYGGIRKLCGKDEISMWKKLWPSEALE
ncbi:F-box protein [Sesamum angolense]|uniref:F-box protein n=1 Tax=Sesamum angolense TaxID=2727404 RepID=A0AAE2C424_9LAMI|nr:F-box protein [Sesamum angolense]